MSIAKVSNNLNIPRGFNLPSSYGYKYPMLNAKCFDAFMYTNAQNNNTVVNRHSTIPIENLYSPRQLLLAYSNPEYVKNLIEKNPNITKILATEGLKPKIYTENITGIYNSHVTTTTAFARQIANKMNISQADKKILEQACVFHDFGKILIPSKILDKPGKLSKKEKDVVDLHAQLGAELLSAAGISNRATELIKNHHNPMSKNADVLGQILSVADIYSALREDRSYKTSMSEREAINLLDQKARKGEVSTEVVEALKEALSSAKSAA